MAKIVIYGAGDIARLAHFYFTKDSDHEVVGFCVDAQFKKADELFGLPITSFEQVRSDFPPAAHDMFVAMGYGGMNQQRADACERGRAAGYTLVSYVSSRCTFLTEHPIGDNCFILEDNTVQPFVKIGSNVTLWSGNHIGHDVVIDDDCFVTSHVVISGNTHVKRGCFLGVNATIRNGIEIGERTLVVAGATILKSTEPESVYAGERAKRLPKSSLDVKL